VWRECVEEEEQEEDDDEESSTCPFGLVLRRLRPFLYCTFESPRTGRFEVT